MAESDSYVSQTVTAEFLTTLFLYYTATIEAVILQRGAQKIAATDFVHRLEVIS